MSGRIFQNVVLQLKENTDRTVGVIDGEGIVIACSELAMIGQRWAEHVPAINSAGGAIVTSEGKTFKALNGWGEPSLTMQPSPSATTRSARPFAPWPRWR